MSAKCTTYIATAAGVRQCSRKATHVSLSKSTIISCTQHARSYDVPMPKAAS